jgi:putative DNA primase/helicase
VVTEHDSQIVSAAEVAGSTSMAIVEKKPRFPSTDLGNAERFALRYGQDVRYVPAWDKWIVWSGKQWKIDDLKRVDRFAQVTVRAIYREAQDEADMDRRKALAEHAKKSEAHARKVALLDHAKSLPEIPITPTDLDTDPYLLNVQNGTLDLRSGELREHRREDLITKLAHASFDPTAKCPLYDTFFEKVQPDATVRDLIWRLDGSCLAGVVRDHVFPIHYGSGRNGKGVHTNTLLHVLGDYARQVPTELLMAKKGDVHPTDKTTLFGIRFAAAVESEEGKSLNVGFVKQMTGGDRISARRMREDFWEFDPTHKIQLSTNHRPVIRETKDAIWERVLLIPWDVKIPSEHQDKQLGEKLKLEADGILLKLVQHCLAWQQDGLKIPERVRAATTEYRDDMDVLGEFVNTWCIEDAKTSSGASRIYDMYKNWAEDGGEYVMSQTAFGRQLGERGFIKERCSRTGRIVWKGLRVRTSDDDLTVNTSPMPYREPGHGMSVTDILEEIAAAEQSEQFEHEFSISAHESHTLGGTGNLLQTIQTIQPTSTGSTFIELSCTMMGTASVLAEAEEFDFDRYAAARGIPPV